MPNESFGENPDNTLPGSNEIGFGNYPSDLSELLFINADNFFQGGAIVCAGRIGRTQFNHDQVLHGTGGDKYILHGSIEIHTGSALEMIGVEVHVQQAGAQSAYTVTLTKAPWPEPWSIGDLHFAAGSVTARKEAPTTPEPPKPIEPKKQPGPEPKKKKFFGIF